MDDSMGIGFSLDTGPSDNYAPQHAGEGERVRFQAHDRPDRRGHLTELIRSLIFSDGNIPHSLLNSSLHWLVLDLGVELPEPLYELVTAPPDQWSLEQAIRLLTSAHSDHFAQLAILELACRELGEKWCRDNSSFVTVSIGASRLQSILRRISLRSTVRQATSANATALFLTAPGEQHTFGPCLLEELFRAQGWATRSRFPEAAQMSGLRKDIDECQVVCFSWSSGALEDAALDTVTSLQRYMSPGRTLFLAGGTAALENRQQLERAGFDYVCTNGYTGLAIAERFASDSLFLKSN